jgi:subtilase family serine protease
VRLKKGPRSLAATADPTSGISESDEGNNALKVTARCNGDD